MNLYISHFSDGVLFSYSTVYQKNGHWRRRRVVDGRARRFQARILVPGWNPNRMQIFFFANFDIYKFIRPTYSHPLSSNTRYSTKVVFTKFPSDFDYIKLNTPFLHTRGINMLCRILGGDYVGRMNLYISHFSDGVLFSYSTVYKKNGHWRRRRGGGWQSATISSADIGPGLKSQPDANLFFR